MAWGVDLVITFRTTEKNSLSKQKIREDSQKARQQYARLLQTLTKAGLCAVGRRGEALGHLLILVHCPEQVVVNLFKRECATNSLAGLATTPVPLDTNDLSFSSAERLRIVHSFITSTPADGGLGIHPESHEWNFVESILVLHDKKFNENLRRWTFLEIFSVNLEEVRGQFGEAVALYYAFLVFYTKALIFPAFLGILFYIFSDPYSPTYSLLVFIWSVVFVEWWRVRERSLSLQFGTLGSFRVEKHRVDYQHHISRLERECRMIVSLPILVFCAFTLILLLTGIFALEAFVTAIYKGPGRIVIPFAPTILFAALVPQFLALYKALARRLTAWENHSHQSTHSASLTLKTFALSSLVAYLGLGLSAYVYVPFGEGLMQVTQTWIFNKTNAATGNGNTFGAKLVTTPTGDNASASSFWDIDTSGARHKLNPSRLRQQMFAYMVTGQIVNTFMEVGLPFILRAVSSFRNGKKSNGTPGTSTEKNGAKKRVVFEDEKERGGMEEREFLDDVRAQVELPDYDLFADYDEMVTQFGYVSLWSTIWPLASVMALLNNFFELRSDAFKMTVHTRRPIPIRTDTIGPWLDALTVLTWLSALTNSTLVYLFCPRSQGKCSPVPGINTIHLDKVHDHLFSNVQITTTEADSTPTAQLLTTTLLIALVASHGYIIIRGIVRHIVERVLWSVSEGEKLSHKDNIDIGTESTCDNEEILQNRTRILQESMGPLNGKIDGFWEHDEGLDEISRVNKEA